MGWSGNTIDSFNGIKAFMKDYYNFDAPSYTMTLLDYAVLNRNTVYAAVETVVKADGSREVWAAVILFRFNRREYMYRNMEESMGPCEIACPKRILELLTPTTNEYAVKWRKKCWDFINSRDFEMKPGLVLVNRYHEYKLTIIEPYYGRRWKCKYSDNSTVYQMSKCKLIKQGYTTEGCLFAEKL